MDNVTTLSPARSARAELTAAGFTADQFDVVMDNGVAKIALTSEGLVDFWKRCGTSQARKALRLYDRALKDMERGGHSSAYAKAAAINYALRATGMTPERWGR